MRDYLKTNIQLAKFIKYRSVNEEDTWFQYDDAKYAIYMQSQNVSIDPIEFQFSESFDWIIPIAKECMKLGILDTIYSFNFSRAIFQFDLELLYDTIVEYLTSINKI